MPVHPGFAPSGCAALAGVAGAITVAQVSVYQSLVDYPLMHSGKVRELYARPDGTILMVATDAVSAFDYVLDAPIPDKGKVLTGLTLWWFDQLGDVVPNHLISLDVPQAVRGRAMVVENLDMVPIECIARGYLTGSGWAEYQKSGTVTGIALPPGLHDGSRLSQPIFTPSTKADIGQHDENIDFAAMCSITGDALGAQIRDSTLDLYSQAEVIARARGIILADTKFEFGRRSDGTLVLADEVLTPDSSRYWDLAAWQRGDLSSFDKQYLRDWLTGPGGWSKSSGLLPPTLPPDIIDATRQRYIEAYELLTGQPFTG